MIDSMLLPLKTEARSNFDFKVAKKAGDLGEYWLFSWTLKRSSKEEEGAMRLERCLRDLPGEEKPPLLLLSILLLLLCL